MCGERQPGDVAPGGQHRPVDDRVPEPAPAHLDPGQRRLGRCSSGCESERDTSGPSAVRVVGCGWAQGQGQASGVKPGVWPPFLFPCRELSLPTLP